MARKRMISPELLISESVARLPIPTRYFFVGLWMYLDDEGRGRDNAALICAHQWPLDATYTAERVEADLILLAAELICRYQVGGKPYLHSPSWRRWQKVNHPTPSRVPPCPLELAGDVDHVSLPCHYRSPTGVLLESYGINPGLLPHNVVELNVDQSSLTASPAAPSEGGSDGLAAARNVVKTLKQRQPSDTPISA